MDIPIDGRKSDHRMEATKGTVVGPILKGTRHIHILRVFGGFVPQLRIVHRALFLRFGISDPWLLV